MTDMSSSGTDLAEQDPAQRLRHELVASLQENGWVRNTRIADALATVPRHRFIPHVDVQTAYGHATVSVKDDGDASLSCASVPAIVAMMLEQLQLHPDHRVLELGAGTGYNAALLAHLTAPHGDVTTVDVDPDLSKHARTHLDDTGYSKVRVVCDDGVDGRPEEEPFDRIMATVGVFDIPPAWLAQLAPTGKLVVPVRLAGDASRSIAFIPADGYWQGVDVRMCTFMPLRNSRAADPRTVLDLTGDGNVTLQVNRDQNIPSEAVDSIFDERRSDLWTGVVFGRMESFGDLWLWLALTLENSLSRMPVTNAATEAGTVEPMLRWGSMATTSPSGGRGLAYLTLRPTTPTPNGEERSEVGVIGHGTEGTALAEHMAREIIRWGEHYRNREVGIDLYPHSRTPPQPAPGRFVLDRPTAHIAVTWRE